MTHFFVKKAKTGKVIGPLSARQVKKFCFETRIKGKDLLSTDLKNWRCISLIPDLYSDDTATREQPAPELVTPTRLPVHGSGGNYQFWNKRPGRGMKRRDASSNTLAWIGIGAFLVALATAAYFALNSGMLKKDEPGSKTSAKPLVPDPVSTTPAAMGAHPAPMQPPVAPAPAMPPARAATAVAEVPADQPALPPAQTPATNPPLPHDAIGSDGLNDLSRAIYLGRLDDVRRLLVAGASVLTKTGPKHYSPVVWAMVQQRADIALELVNAGAALGDVDDLGQTPLHWAAGEGNMDLLQACLKRGADLNALDLRQRTPLHAALHARKTDAASQLLTSGAKVNLRDDQGNDELLLALHAKDAALVDKLLSLDVDKNHVNQAGECALDIALKIPLPAIRDQLQSQGAMSVADFFDAIARADIGLMDEMLFKAPEFAGAKSAQGYLALQKALLSAKKDQKNLMLEALLAKGAKATALGINGDTPLHTAADQLDEKLVGLLLKSGADLNVRNAKGQTLLHRLVTINSESAQGLLRLLLDKGADINIKDAQGVTAVEACVNWNNAAALEILVENGANVNALTVFNVTLLDAARMNNKAEVESVLRAHGALRLDQLPGQATKPTGK